MKSIRWPAIATVFVFPILISAQSDWPSVGRDEGAARFSPLRQITPANVTTLKRAWTFHTGASGDFEGPPLVIGNRIYFSADNGVYALESHTGTLVWTHQARISSRRGLAYWPGDARSPARFFVAVDGTKMAALDVSTGALLADFGEGGYLDLGRAYLSAPAIYRDLVITTGGTAQVRAWNVRTGAPVWTFNLIAQPGDPGFDSWDPEQWKNASGTTIWGFVSLDVQRGLLFLPTKTATPDFFGGNRRGNNLYGNSLIAVNAATGKLVWYQQLVHHDLWDYDLSAAPALVESVQNGRRVPAVAQITKMGMLFLFDRETGAPLFGMEERPVPQSTLDVEFTSPTQPFPLKPPPLARMSLTEEELADVTPEHAAFCRDAWTRLKIRNDGPYTPMRLNEYSVTFPSTIGGGNWGGVSFNPELGYVFANVMNLGQVGVMEKRVDPQTGAVSYSRVRPPPFNEVSGHSRFWNPANRWPCSPPPWGELIAVNVNTGDIAWKVPLGTVDELAAQGMPNTGALNLGGSIATAGGLVFIAATNDSRFRAFDAKTGRELWVEKIDATGHSIPVTYLGSDNKQYVVVPAGGGGYFGATPGDSLIAFALP
jgi:quinoprotein glucose dehydrogenase